MKLFFWTEDEYSCPELTKKYADKIWHFLGCAFLTIVLYCKFGLHPVFAALCVWLSALIIWEIIIDCYILFNGASKLDILANTLGVMLAVGVIYV